MKTSLCFQFHNAVLFEVRSNIPHVLEFFNSEYGYHRVDNGCRKRNHNATVAPLPVVELTYLNKINPVQEYNHYTHKFLAHWLYQVQVSPERVTIKVSGNKLSVPMVHHMMVHPSLRYLASQHGFLLLHAGAVARKGKSLIFSGRGGAGKTTVTSLVLAYGNRWSLHADDYVFLKPGPFSFAYQTRSHLYRNLLLWVPEVKSRLTPWELTRVEFFGFVRKWSGERFKWPVRLSAERLWPGSTIQDFAVPVSVLLLRKGNQSSAELEQEKDIEQVAAELIEMNFNEARHFISLLDKTNAIPDFSGWLADWKLAERRLLLEILRRTPVYTLKLPVTNSRSELSKQLLSILDELAA